MFIVALVYDFLRTLHRITPLNEKRRLFLKKSIDGGFFGAGAIYISSSIENGLSEPIINPVKVESGHLKKPITLVQISDLHIGGIIDKNYVKNVVEKINILKPDIVALTGDLIDADIDGIKDRVDELKNIKSKYGVYFCAGNHEYFHDLEKIINYLKKLNIIVLENEVHTVFVEDEALQIAGVLDLFGYRYGKYQPNINRVIKHTDKNIPTIFLVHQPKFIEEFKTTDFYPTLTLSGHTHGGQIYPFGLLVRAVQPYLKGLHRIKEGSFIYVNSGTGFWGPPMRIGTSSEISTIEFS